MISHPDLKQYLNHARRISTLTATIQGDSLRKFAAFVGQKCGNQSKFTVIITLFREMIYIACMVFVALSHWINQRGRSGLEVPVVLEKIVVLVAAVMGLLTIVELGSWVASLFKSPDDEFSGWLPGILVYPVAIPLFVIFILVALPEPIQRKSRQNKSCEATSDTARR
jgi:hypothetical protein